MSLFRKKPVVIEAFRYIPRGPGAGRYFDDMPQWLETAYEDDVVSNVIRDEQHQLKIKTLEGDMYADAYDWIIRGVKGEIYPCKPDIFDVTYEEAALRSSSDPDAVRALEVDPALAKVLTYNAAYTLEIRRNVIEECAQAVINAIPLLPMGRVDASELCDAVQDEAVRAVRALKDATPGSHFPAGSIGEWPSGCHDPESCYRHQDCMYLNCAWRGKHTVRSLPASPSLTEKRPPSNQEGRK